MSSLRRQVPRIAAVVVVFCIFQTFFVYDFLKELCRRNDICTGRIPSHKAKTTSQPTIYLFRDFPKRQQQNQGPAVYFSLDNETFGGVKARSFAPWRGAAVPCLEPELTWDQHDTQMSPTRDGLLFVKTYGTGSSTVTSIHLRIARNVAKRRKTGFEMCKVRFEHARASSLDRQSSLDRDKAFLWTIVREPRTRAISQLSREQVSQDNQSSTDKSPIARIRNDTAMFRDYYLNSLSLKGFRRRRSDPVQTANEIVQQYDFIAVTERMDESIVALSMMLKVPLTDVLYLEADGKEGYNDVGKKVPCTYTEPAIVSAGMIAFIESEEYYDMVHGDTLLYQAANQSLDLTIDALGRDIFERKLSRFRHAQEEAVQRCLPTTRFPCAADGTRRKETDCLWKDSACDQDCLDRVATDLTVNRW